MLLDHWPVLGRIYSRDGRVDERLAFAWWVLAHLPRVANEYPDGLC